MEAGVLGDDDRPCDGLRQRLAWRRVDAEEEFVGLKHAQLVHHAEQQRRPRHADARLCLQVLQLGFRGSTLHNVTMEAGV